MNFPVSSERIAAILAAPVKNVAANWPLIAAALEGRGIWSNAVGVAALATIGVECPPFKPVKEYGGDAYLNRQYDTRTDLGNTPERDGDGARYGGRGFIQITGRANYEQYGKLLGVDLVGQPERALEPVISAEILARYFASRGVHLAANAGNWRRVRKLVNGGYNHLPRFLSLVTQLLEAARG